MSVHRSVHRPLLWTRAQLHLPQGAPAWSMLRMALSLVSLHGVNTEAVDSRAHEGGRRHRISTVARFAGGHVTQTRSQRACTKIIVYKKLPCAAKDLELTRIASAMAYEWHCAAPRTTNKHNPRTKARRLSTVNTTGCNAASFLMCVCKRHARGQATSRCKPSHLRHKGRQRPGQTNCRPIRKRRKLTRLCGAF